MRVERWTARAVTILLLSVGVASAHGGGSFDAPIPLSYLFAGAGVTVAATAVLAAETVRPGDADADAAADTDADAVVEGVGRALAVVPGWVAAPARTVARAVFLTLVAAAVAAGVLGPVAADNLAVAFVWPVWVTGLGLWSMVAGSPWRTLSPWRAVYDALCRLEGRRLAVAGDYPDRLGDWPALAGFVIAVGIAGNLTAAPWSPRLTAGLVAAYAGVMVVGGVAFGATWFRRADFLAVLYRLFGRVAPIRVRRTGDGGWRVGVRAPWRAGVRPVASAAVAWFVVAAVYTVSFDGFAASPEYRALADAIGGVLPAGTGLVLYAFGLAGFVAAFHAVARVTRASPLAVAPTLLPIAAAYEAAHSYAYALTNLGTVVEALAGAVGVTVAVHPLGWLSLPAFWASQVVLVVAGHVVAVLAAHVVVAGGDASRRGVLLSHAPLTGLMVGYTVLSLWIVSRPVAG